MNDAVFRALGRLRFAEKEVRRVTDSRKLRLAEEELERTRRDLEHAMRLASAPRVAF